MFQATGLPACDSLINQPCRPDPGAVPPGSPELLPEQGQPPDQGDSAPGRDRTSGWSPMPATGGAAGMMGVIILLAGGLMAGVATRRW